MNNKRNLKTILIPDLDKPEYGNMTRILNEFMDKNQINSITKTLPALFQHYEFILFELESWKEKHTKDMKENYEVRKALKERINVLETGEQKIIDFITHFLPTKP